MELHLYYSPYCPHCRDARIVVDEVIQTLTLDCTVEERDVLVHIDAAVGAGVRVTPAVTLDGRLVAAGRLERERLMEAVASMLAGEAA